jgi:hypothetical protein
MARKAADSSEAPPDNESQGTPSPAVRSEQSAPEKAFWHLTQEEKLARIEELRDDLSDEEIAEARRRILEGID